MWRAMNDRKTQDGKITRSEHDARIVLRIDGSYWTKRYSNTRAAMQDALHLGLFTERRQADEAERALRSVTPAEHHFDVPKPFETSALWNDGFLPYEVQAIRRAASPRKKFFQAFVM